jgi:hypothetical protein
MADAHLNGSLNLPSAEDVFRTVAVIAGDSRASRSTFRSSATPRRPVTAIHSSANSGIKG